MIDSKLKDIGCIYHILEKTNFHKLYKSLLLDYKKYKYISI